ncbi:MAG: alpha-glucosidase/alpha-galactosidase [Candidatus Izemoplasmatales bacterium]|nr:alpha-glucosidase/alpha-galactosidase [bacterium]MDZ4196270.1 alpha-glucosidase/alpha-galactosidase [Candidatus Izemoplasmatales bacterium]
MKKTIQIAYIGGGSRLWARSLMSDLSAKKDFSCHIRLYDIDQEAAKRNQQLGTLMMSQEKNTAVTFEVVPLLDQCLQDVDFVLISILPGTFDDMETYVHLPEKYGIYQTVGDTTGPSGIFRSLIMMPMFETIGKAIKIHCPNAWVINFTNPMTMCVQTLYHVFPQIKAFGNCHEVFFVQKILARSLEEATGFKASYKEIQINPIGLNHFTWINYATYRGIDLLPIYHQFALKYQDSGLLPKDTWKQVGPFGSAEKVKLDLFLKTGVIAAAGDRHLVEFLPHEWYVKDLSTIEHWRFHLTKVQTRKDIMRRNDESAKRLIQGMELIPITPSGEEGLAQIEALLGKDSLITNVNMPNTGQISNLPLGHVVETNALFRFNQVQPILSGPLPEFPLTYTLQHIEVHRLLLQAFDSKSLSYARKALHQDVSLSSISPLIKDTIFDELVRALGPSLTYYHQ